MSTLAIQLWNGQQRDVRQGRTELALPILGRHRDLRALFVAAYAKFGAACRAVDEPGVALVAIDEDSGEACGLVRIRARISRHVVAMVGRHPKCDLFLDAKTGMALRHLVVVVDPVTSFAPSAQVGYRILDLRTTHAFTDETGRTLRGLRAEGPSVLRCAGYVVFALPLGDPTDWPAAGDDAWSMLPERVYFDEATCREEHRSMLSRSLLLRTHGPRETTMLELVATAGGGPCGTLELIGVKQRGAIPVGTASLRDGLLLGRYTRCDSAGLADDTSLSRVHVLLLQIDDTLLAIDTASSNGIRLLGCPDERVIAVPDRAELGLGKATRLRWRRR